jgi:hypothetical protein
MANHIVYYKGEGGGFPQVWAVVSLMCPCYPWLVLAPKVFQLCTNHFVWVVHMLVWVSETCQLFLVPSRSSNMPFYPSKCCELGSVLWLFPLPLSSTWTHIWVHQGVGSASHSGMNIDILDPSRWKIHNGWWPCYSCNTFFLLVESRSKSKIIPRFTNFNENPID